MGKRNQQTKSPSPSLYQNFIVFSQNCPPEMTYNMDETALFWKIQPKKSLVTKRVSGSKLDKARMTVVVCANELELIDYYCGLSVKARIQDVSKDFEGEMRILRNSESTGMLIKRVG